MLKLILALTPVVIGGYAMIIHGKLSIISTILYIACLPIMSIHLIWDALKIIWFDVKVTHLKVDGDRFEGESLLSQSQAHYRANGEVSNGWLTLTPAFISYHGYNTKNRRETFEIRVDRIIIITPIHTLFKKGIKITLPDEETFIEVNDSQLWSDEVLRTMHALHRSNSTIVEGPPPLPNIPRMTPPPLPWERVEVPELPFEEEPLTQFIQATIEEEAEVATNPEKPLRRGPDFR